MPRNPLPQRAPAPGSFRTAMLAAGALTGPTRGASALDVTRARGARGARIASAWNGVQHPAHARWTTGWREFPPTGEYGPFRLATQFGNRRAATTKGA